MLNKVFSSIVAFIIFAVSIYVPQTAEASYSLGAPLSARAAVIYDIGNRKIMYSKNRNTKRQPASTTKVMTALVVLDRLNLNKVVKVNVNTSHISPTKLYLKPGEKFYVKDLLRALLIKSSNDVATVIAHHISGSERSFAKLMNQKARQIGAKSTRFVNPHGLPGKGQYTTPYDLALIMKEAKKYPFIMKTMATKTTHIKNLAGKRYYLKNHNKMLWRDSRPIIGKTGFTRAALYCFVGRISYNKRDFLVSILGSLSPWNDLKKMLDFYSRLTIGKKGKKEALNEKNWSRRRRKIFEISLKNLGYNPGRADGSVTKTTVKAIKQFQSKKGLTPDGIIGKETSKKLAIAVNNKNWKLSSKIGRAHV